jgi:hypothetical protein
MIIHQKSDLFAFVGAFARKLGFDVSRNGTTTTCMPFDKLLGFSRAPDLTVSPAQIWDLTIFQLESTQLGAQGGWPTCLKFAGEGRLTTVQFKPCSKQGQLGGIDSIFVHDQNTGRTRTLHGSDLQRGGEGYAQAKQVLQQCLDARRRALDELNMPDAMKPPEALSLVSRALDHMPPGVARFLDRRLHL